VQGRAVRGGGRYRGRALAAAAVVSPPAAPLPPGVPRPMATTDAAGRFRLTTLKPGDGAPAGAYAVTVELRAESSRGEEVTRDGSTLLPARYARPETSRLNVTVGEGDNEALPLRLVGP